MLLNLTAWERSWLDIASWTLELHVSQPRLLELGLASLSRSVQSGKRKMTIGD
jgi:hypothetical protein